MFVLVVGAAIMLVLGAVIMLVLGAPTPTTDMLATTDMLPGVDLADK